jgi:hypothetical protein
MKHTKYKNEQVQKDLAGLQKEMDTLKHRAIEIKREQLAHTQKDSNAYGVIRRKIALISTYIRSTIKTQ